MKCGHLSMKNGTNAGFGRLSAAALAKSRLSLWVIEARQPAASFGAKPRIKDCQSYSDFWEAYQLVS
jgi:hypothetical protein